MEGASAYGIELINTKLANPQGAQDTRRIFAATVLGGETSYRLDPHEFPAGTYRWCVIAFDNKGVMGKFSQERSFSITARGQ